MTKSEPSWRVVEKRRERRCGKKKEARSSEEEKEGESNTTNLRARVRILIRLQPIERGIGGRELIDKRGKLREALLISHSGITSTMPAKRRQKRDEEKEK